jgi:hypothetical protein
MHWPVGGATALTGADVTQPPSGKADGHILNWEVFGTGKFLLELGKFWN